MDNGFNQVAKIPFFRSPFSIFHSPFSIPFRFLAHGSPEGHLLQFAAYRCVVEQEEQQEPVQFAHKSKELLVKM